MKTPTQYFPSIIIGGLIAVLVLTQTAFTQPAIAQDPQDAAQQAAQQANQQATQNTQQAMDAAQRASQQAMQDALAGQSSSSLPVPLGGVRYPPLPDVPSGPVPASIANARSVVLTNVGITPRLGLDTNTLYNDIHSRLEQWGYYQLVSSPQQADLIFQLDEIDPRNGANVTPATDVYNRTPSFRIVILDARTGIALWTVTAPIYITGRKTYAHWIDVSEEGLITRLKALAHQPISPEEQADLTQYPKNHRSALLLILPGVALAGGLGMYLAYRHSISDQKANQDAFCKANNIPLSMCAGG